MDYIFSICILGLFIYCIISGLAKRFGFTIPDIILSIKLNKRIKNEKNFVAIDKDMARPCRGTNLDKQLKNFFIRNKEEKDWDFVKRIFPTVFRRNPSGALSILFGKPLESLGGPNHALTIFFLKRYYKSSSKKRELYLQMFIDDFKHYPAL
ncbi:MAG: hypothetical protein ACOYL8_03825 [Patescibacteria group bacterium]